MPAAIPLAAQIAAVVGVGAAGLSGTVVGSLIVAGAGIVSGLVARNNLGRDSTEQIRGQELVTSNLVTTQRTIPLVYGERLVGSNDVYIEMAGANFFDMWIVHCLGEGECSGIAQENGVDLIYVNDKLVSDYPPGDIEYTFHSGTSTQSADYYLEEASDGKFTDPMRNTAYIVFKIDYSDSKYHGIPKRTVVLKGIKVLDFRTASISWSQNPVLILYDYLTNTRYGLGWDPSLLDISTWTSSANYCDLEDLGTGKTKYYIDYVVATQVKAQTVIDTILGHFRGSLSWFGGTLFLHYSDLRYEAPVFGITDDHIARNPSTRADSVTVSQPSRHGLPDGVLVKFINARNNWTLDDFPVGDSNGQVIPIEFPGFTNRALALDMGRYSLERQRLNRAYTIILRSDTIVLDVNDVVTLTSTELAFSDQLCRVRQSNIMPEGLLQVTLIIEDISLYDSYYQPDTSDIYDVDLMSPLSPPPSIDSASVVEQVYNYRGRSYVRLNVDFSPPSNYPWFSHVEVYVNHGSWQVLLSASDSFQVDPVQENTTYDFRLVSVSTFGVKQEFNDGYNLSHYVNGINSSHPPSPLYLTATVNGNSVDLYSPPLDSPDIDAWEYRTGDSWSTAVLIASQKYPTISYTGFRPGNSTIWLDTWRDVSPPHGLYGLVPKGANISIESPPPYHTILYETLINFTEGTHSNTEAVEQGENWGLQCSHNDGSLSGEYMSKEYDTLNLDMEVIIIYLLFSFVVTGTYTTWDEVAPNPTPWRGMPHTSSWTLILGLLSEPTKLDIDALCSVSPGGPYFTANRLELLTSSVKARYFKLRFRITDINLSSYLLVQPTTFVATEREVITPPPPPP